MKKVSILGDSISTFEGYNPDGYAVYYDSLKQEINDLTCVDDTWWAQVIRALDGQLCVNNAYSGSKVTGYDFPAASSEIRCGSLHTAQEQPDIIMIDMGSNDFGYGVPVYRKRFSFKQDCTVFFDAYGLMLDRLTHYYPNAAVIYTTLTRTAIIDTSWAFPENFAGVPFNDYNNAIRHVKQRKNCYLADLCAPDFRYETLDGSHPTRLGHRQLADAWIYALTQLGFISS